MKRLSASVCAAALTAVLLSLSSCGSANIPDYSGYAPAQDCRLLIYTSLEEDLYAPLVKEFEERTGVWVQVETGSTVRLAGRSGTEKGAPDCDLILSDGCESLEALSRLFSPYTGEVPVRLADIVPEDGRWTPFTLSPLVLIYNPKLVRTNPPAGWESLLDPAWRGKIAFPDPQTAGDGCTALALLAQGLPGGREELWRALLNNLNGRLYGDPAQTVREVAGGNCYIGVVTEESALRGIKNGDDLALVYPKEGTALIPCGLAIVSGCENERNARLFIEFLLGKDAQSYLSDSCLFRSTDAAKEDSVGGTDPFAGKNTGRTETAGGGKELPLLSYDSSATGQGLGELLALWQSLRGEVTP